MDTSLSRPDDLRTLLRQRWRGALLIWGVCVAAGAIAAWLAPRSYESTTLVRGGRVEGSLIEEPATLLQVVRSEEFLREVGQIPMAAELSPDEIARRLRVEEKAGQLQIVARGRTPEEARQLAAACVTAIVERHARLQARYRQAMEDTLKGLRDQEQDLVSRHGRLERGLGRAGTSGQEATTLLMRLDAIEGQLLGVRQAVMEQRARMVRLIDPATTPVSPTVPRRAAWPRPALVLLVAAVAGLLLGLGWTFAVEFRW